MMPNDAVVSIQSVGRRGKHPECWNRLRVAGSGCAGVVSGVVFVTSTGEPKRKGSGSAVGLGDKSRWPPVRFVSIAGMSTCPNPSGRPLLHP